jgi:diketogulonate reductase-like aldo/keto reductase
LKQNKTKSNRQQTTKQNKNKNNKQTKKSPYQVFIKFLIKELYVGLFSASQQLRLKHNLGKDCEYLKDT